MYIYRYIYIHRRFFSKFATLSLAKPHMLRLKSTPRFKDIRLNCVIGYVRNDLVFIMTSWWRHQPWENFEKKCENCYYLVIIFAPKQAIRHKISWTSSLANLISFSTMGSKSWFTVLSNEQSRFKDRSQHEIFK